MLETEGCSHYHTCHVKQHATWIGNRHLFFVERCLNLINPSRDVMGEVPNGISDSIVLQKKTIRLNLIEISLNGENLIYVSHIACTMIWVVILKRKKSLRSIIENT